MKQDRHRVLIVDNDESMLLSLEWLLKREGCETTLAWSAPEARLLLASHRFDVVFVNAEFGEAIVAELQEHRSATRCAVLDPRTRMQQIDALCGLGGAVTASLARAAAAGA